MIALLLIGCSRHPQYESDPLFRDNTFAVTVVERPQSDGSTVTQIWVDDDFMLIMLVALIVTAGFAMSVRRGSK